MNTLFPLALQQQLISYLTPTMVWGFFVVVIALLVVVSLIIVWHWQKHGVGVLRRTGVEIVYLLITAGIAFLFFLAVTNLLSQI